MLQRIRHSVKVTVLNQRSFAAMHDYRHKGLEAAVGLRLLERPDFAGRK